MKQNTFLFFIISAFLFLSCSHGDSDIHNHTGNSGNQSDNTAGHLAGGPENEHQAVHYPEEIRLDTVRTGSFAEILKTSGVLIAGNGNLVHITARSSGIVDFTTFPAYPGMKVSKGQILFLISGGGLADDNPITKIEHLKSDLERAKANYERAQKLLPEKIITQEHFLSMKNEYEKIETEYSNLIRNFRENNAVAVAPEDGYIRDIYITAGQKISSGQLLASVQKTDGMVLKVLLPPDKAAKASSVSEAWFRLASFGKLYKTEELNGKIISAGKSTGENSYFLPLFFSIDYLPEVPEGTFAEVYLRGREIPDAITIPNSAVMEEFGRYYVYVKDEDGDFIKRYIIRGGDDGERTIVTEGLLGDEVIISEGGWQVKLSQMAGTVPAHVHNH